MILAGDIGGTHTRLALLHEEGGRLVVDAEQVYISREYAGLDEPVKLFLNGAKGTVQTACFGIAGPVIKGRATTPNLTWVVDVQSLVKSTSIASIWLINDLQAHASGVDDLRESDFVPLKSASSTEGNAALIAAGTGLGEAGLYWDGVRRHAFACEGGHADFAPRNDLEIELHRYLLAKFGRVSYERVVSGPGLKNIYEFLRDSRIEAEPQWLRDELDSAPDPAVVISGHGLLAKAAICERALDIFVSVYGAEAGNLALKLLATGGVFLSGGIAFKIVTRLQRPDFLQAFVDKGRLRPLMEGIPVRVVNNEQVGLIGAARYALQQARKAPSPCPAQVDFERRR